MMDLSRNKMEKNKLIILMALIISIILIIIYGANLGINFGKFQVFIKHLGVLAPVIFTIIYIFAPVLFFPITFLSIAGGMLFGPIVGTSCSLIGATCGASVSFFISRYLLKDWIDSKSHAKVILFQNMVKKEGWKFVAILRISPFLPFNLQNYFFGVTNLSHKTFFIATFFSLIPGTFTYAYLGYTGQSALSGGENITIKITIALILLLLFGFYPYIIKAVKKLAKIPSRPL